MYVTCTCVDDMMKRKAHLMCSVYVVDSVCTKMMMTMCVCFFLYVIITVVVIIAIAIFIVRHLCPIIKQLLLL